MRRGRRTLALVVVCALTLSSCAVQGSRSADAVWAQRVNDLRQSADDRIARGDLATGEADLLRILTLKRPDGDSRGLQLLQDAHFALGTLYFATKRYDQALDQAHRGLKLTDARSIFSANLHALRAMTLEASGKELDALEDYAAALAIHKELFDAAAKEH